jgi:Fe-S oxidoreductase
MSSSVSGGREGSLEAPTRHPLDWKNPEFYNEAALEKELERVFDICHGCRRCFSLCNSFPTLFDAIDGSSTGELDRVDKKVYWEVVDHCYLCDMCFMTKCPYVPPHPWNVDFPHLMLRAKAVHSGKHGLSTRNKILASTDTVGAIAGIPVVVEVVNAVNQSSLGRKVLDKVLGVHPEAPIPKYHSNTARKRLKDLIGTTSDAARNEASLRANPAVAADVAPSAQAIAGAGVAGAGNAASGVGRATESDASTDAAASVDDAVSSPSSTAPRPDAAAGANNALASMSAAPTSAPVRATAGGVGAPPPRETAAQKLARLEAASAALERGEPAPAARQPAANPAAPIPGAPPARETAAQKLARLEAAAAAMESGETASSVSAVPTQAPGAKGTVPAPAPTSTSRSITGRVAIFTTCYGNRNEPDLDVDLVKVFQHNGVEVRLVAQEKCCGMPKLELGDLESVARHKDFNIPHLKKVVEDGYDIVAPIPSCVLMFKQELPLMFPQDADVKLVQSRIFDPFEYLMLLHRAGKLRTDFKQSLGKVSYHVPCHLRVQNIGLKTRDVLKLVPDTTVDVIERCSGHNGTYAVKKEFRAASVKIGRPVMTRVESAQPAYYTSDCPMAGHQIESGIKDAKEPTHPLKLLRIAYGL